MAQNEPLPDNAEESSKRRVDPELLRRMNFPEPMIEEALAREKSGVFNYEPPADLVQRTQKAVAASLEATAGWNKAMQQTPNPMAVPLNAFYEACIADEKLVKAFIYADRESPEAKSGSNAISDDRKADVLEQLGSALGSLTQSLLGQMPRTVRVSDKPRQLRIDWQKSGDAQWVGAENADDARPLQASARIMFQSMGDFPPDISRELAAKLVEGLKAGTLTLPGFTQSTNKSEPGVTILEELPRGIKLGAQAGK